MALEYNILSYKNTVNKDGTDFIDLGSKSFDKDLPLTGSFVIVNSMYVGRPDLISLALYGDDKYGDIICKVNGISNPFELNENDIIFVPDQNYILDCCKVFEQSKDDFIEDSSSSIVENKIEQLTKYQKKLTDRRSPHEQIKGGTNYVIDNTLGVVIY